MSAGRTRLLAIAPAAPSGWRPGSGRALAVGHSPTNEAAVLGLTGELVPPISKGAGVLVEVETDRTRVEPVS